MPDQDHAGFIARERPGDAIPWLEKACEWDPSAGRTWRLLGLARGLAGDQEGAIAAFAEGTRQAPDDAALWFALGAMQQQAGYGRPALQRAAELGHAKARQRLDATRR